MSASKLHENYFTPSELAKAYGVSKSLLLFYDKEKIFMPDFTDENGYRYYSPKQYFILQVLIDLRRLGIGLPTIRQYINHRDADTLNKILIGREKEISTLKDNLEKQLGNIDFLKSCIAANKTIALNNLKISYQEEEYLLRSNEFRQYKTCKKHLTLFIKQIEKYFEDEAVIDPFFGVIISNKDFCSHNYCMPAMLFKKLQTKCFNCFIKPKGNYLTMYKLGTKKNIVEQAGNIFTDYFNTHHLQAKGDFYLTPIQNYFLTDKLDKYIFRCEIAIKEI